MHICFIVNQSMQFSWRLKNWLMALPISYLLLGPLSYLKIGPVSRCHHNACIITNDLKNGPYNCEIEPVLHQIAFVRKNPRHTAGSIIDWSVAVTGDKDSFSRSLKYSLRVRIMASYSSPWVPHLVLKFLIQDTLRGSSKCLPGKSNVEFLAFNIWIVFYFC